MRQRRGPGTGARRRDRGRSGLFLLRPAPGSVPRLLPPPSPLFFQQRRQTLPARREGSQRSASEASGKDGNSSAPSRSPAPGLSPAPRWWQQPRWPGREGITPAICSSLLGARWRPTLARSVAPAAPWAARLEPVAAGRGPAAGGGDGHVGRRSRHWGSLEPTPGCYFAADHGHSAATDWVARQRGLGQMTTRQRSRRGRARLGHAAVGAWGRRNAED